MHAQNSYEGESDAIYVFVYIQATVISVFGIAFIGRRHKQPKFKMAAHKLEVDF